MILLDIIGAVSGYATLESWVKDKLVHKNEKKLDKISMNFNDLTLQSIKDEYTHDKLDRFISQYSLEVNSLEMYLDDIKKKLIEEFFCNNPDLRDDTQYITELISKYIDLLKEYLDSVMSVGEKVIINKINEDMKEHEINYNKLLESIEKRNDLENAYFSEVIINSLNRIDSLINNNTKLNLWRKVAITDINYLKASSLRDVFMRLIKLFENFNFGDISNNEEQNQVESLILWVINLAPDLGIKLNEYFHLNVKPALTCVYNYEIKDSDYYMAIGAIGLFSDYSEGKIFEKVMSKFSDLFTKTCDLLDEIFISRDYNTIQLNAIEKMHSHLLNQIRSSLDDNIIEAIKILLNEGTMLDTVLAERCGITVKDLRVYMYPATKTFLQYQYYDNNSTHINIINPYIKTFRDNYNILLGGGLL